MTKFGRSGKEHECLSSVLLNSIQYYLRVLELKEKKQYGKCTYRNLIIKSYVDYILMRDIHCMSLSS